MDPTQAAPASGPDAPHPIPEVAELQSKLESATGPRGMQSETNSKAAELPGTVQAASTAATNAAISGVQAPVVTPIDPPASTAVQHHSDSPAVADDNDLIEQDWVNKAKAIVERTHDNPYEQNRELSKFKADYMMKRYKREIKVEEE